MSTTPDNPIWGGRFPNATPRAIADLFTRESFKDPRLIDDETFKGGWEFNPARYLGTFSLIDGVKVYALHGRDDGTWWVTQEKK